MEVYGSGQPLLEAVYQRKAQWDEHDQLAAEVAAAGGQDQDDKVVEPERGDRGDELERVAGGSDSVYLRVSINLIVT